MTDTEILEREDQVGEPMPSRPTKRDLIERGIEALNPSEVSKAKVSAIAGGVSFADVVEVMDFAKLMSASRNLVPKYLRGNPGGCLGITFQAIEWRMSPFQVANKSYEVNDRVAYESQLIHAVVEARAPLQHRLDCTYDGEGPTRTCTVIGMFTNGDVREYTTPMFKDIRVKNSPLWKDDPDQQLFYYASRSWARKWVPDVLMGIYSREELAAQPDIGREGEDVAAPGLHARLIGSPRSEDGHKPGHVERQLETVTGKATDAPVEGPDEGAMVDTPKPNKRTSGRPKGSKNKLKPEKAPKQAETQDEPKPVALSDFPATAQGYQEWASIWIGECTDTDELQSRWNKERKLRNDLGMTEEDRAPLLDLIAKRREELGE